MVYLVHLQQYWLHNIVPDELKVCFVQQVQDILLAASEEVVEADHLPQRHKRAHVELG